MFAWQGRSYGLLRQYSASIMLTSPDPSGIGEVPIERDQRVGVELGQATYSASKVSGHPSRPAAFHASF
jgi:hypothetical protein